MLKDALLTFATDDAQVRTAGSYLGASSVPLAAKGIQTEVPPDLVVQITETYAGGTSVEFQVVGADDAALSTNLKVLAASGARKTPVTRANSTAYSAGDVIVVSGAGAFVCTIAGTSAASAPTFGRGGPVTDGGVTWTPSDVELVAGSIAWQPKLPQRIHHAYLGVRAVGVGIHTAGKYSAFEVERAPITRGL